MLVGMVDELTAHESLTVLQSVQVVVVRTKNTSKSRIHLTLICKSISNRFVDSIPHEIVYLHRRLSCFYEADAMPWLSKNLGSLMNQ